MKIKRVENAILTAKQRGDNKSFENIKFILDSRLRVLTVKIDRYMDRGGSTKRDVFKELSSQYSEVLRLSRIVSVYARS